MLFALFKLKYLRAPGHRSFSTLTVRPLTLFLLPTDPVSLVIKIWPAVQVGFRFVDFRACCLAIWQHFRTVVGRPVCLTPCDWPVRPGQLMSHINLSADVHTGPISTQAQICPPTLLQPLERRAQPEYTDGRALKSQEPSFYRSEIFWPRADLVAQFTADTSIGPAAIMSVPFVYDNVGTENL